MPLIGILGGAFDPIHYGHLALAKEAYTQLSLDKVTLVPTYIPCHRASPVANIKHRVFMLKLAISDNSKLDVDTCELDRKGTSFTIDTLSYFKEKNKSATLCLILGMDAFNKIDTWKKWLSLLDFAHIVIANRPGESSKNNISKEHEKWCKQHLSKDLTEIYKSSNGGIYFINIPKLYISSSQIRAMLKNQQTVSKLLPKKTLSYINAHNLYQK